MLQSAKGRYGCVTAPHLSAALAGRDVLVPANTFFATTAAVVHAGGRPVLMDTDLETFGTHPDEIEARITPNTVGAIVVHM